MVVAEVVVGLGLTLLCLATKVEEVGMMAVVEVRVETVFGEEVRVVVVEVLKDLHLALVETVVVVEMVALRRLVVQDSQLPLRMVVFLAVEVAQMEQRLLSQRFSWVAVVVAERVRVVVAAAVVVAVAANQ
jgi:hypothetical protein